VNINTHTNA